MSPGASRVRHQTWKDRLASLSKPAAGNYDHPTSGPGAPWSRPREIWYLLEIARTLRDGWPCISLRQTVLKKDGTRGKLKTASLSLDEVQGLFPVEDRVLLELLIGNERNTGYGFGSSAHPSYLKFSEFAVAPASFEILLPRLCACGRFGWSPDNGSAGELLQPLTWDDGPPWQVKLSISKTTDEKLWALGGTLVRGDRVADLSSPVQLFSTGLVIFRDRIARFEAGNNSRWVALLRQSNPLLVPVREQHQFIERLVQLPERPQIDWPPDLRWEEERPTPLPQLQISKSKNAYSKELECRLTFQYGDRTASFGDGQAGWYDRRLRRGAPQFGRRSGCQQSAIVRRSEDSRLLLSAKAGAILPASAENVATRLRFDTGRLACRGGGDRHSPSRTIDDQRQQQHRLVRFGGHMRLW